MTTPYRPTSPSAVYARHPFRLPMPYGILDRSDLGFWPGTPAIPEGGQTLSLQPFGTPAEGFQAAPSALPPVALTDRDWQIALYLSDLFQLPNPAPGGARNVTTFWQNVGRIIALLDTCGISRTAIEPIYLNLALDPSQVRLAIARIVVATCPASTLANRMRAFWGPSEGVNAPTAVALDIQMAPPIVFAPPGPPAPSEPEPEKKKGIPAWGYALGGVGILVLLGGGIFLATRKRRPRRVRRNPCTCPNPSLFGEPMVSPSVDRNVLSTSHAHTWGEPYEPFENTD